MAEVQQQQVLPAPHIEAASKVYLRRFSKRYWSCKAS
jgi:hypothetical protein